MVSGERRIYFGGGFQHWTLECTSVGSLELGWPCTADLNEKYVIPRLVRRPVRKRRDSVDGVDGVDGRGPVGGAGIAEGSNLPSRWAVTWWVSIIEEPLRRQ
jgi:hypothetical protein